jgi:NADH dehydrogenase [ubiquinone] 1 alpha subcomplex assembly factor 7
MSPLEKEIRALIETEGPIPVSRYMALCLSDSRHGYYATHDPLGAAGDFTTAPEISQMFGEILGLWCAEVWSAMKSPEKVCLVELGPGRGTMMDDLLRAAKIIPEFSKALDVHLVELSPVLVNRQKQTLEKSEVRISWHKDVSTLPNEPLIVVGNEFVDALPIDQFVKTAEGWCERCIGLIENKLQFGLNPIPVRGISEILPAHLRSAPAGSVLERRELGCLRKIASCIARFGGAALIIDYGEEQTKLCNTLQAVRKHEFADPLELPGKTDLTSLVDFETLGAVTEKEGARVFGPIRQSIFLRRLGIELRAERLKERADAKTRADIDTALARLVGGSPRHMGDLFKVLAFAHPSLPVPPGFDT